MRSAPRICFRNACAPLSYPRKALAAIGCKILRSEKCPPNPVIEIIFCNNKLIKKLNTQFRNKPYATDVLSFNYNDDDLLGEIYVSLERAKTQAREYGTTYNEEVKRLVIHGMLHVLGYDHKQRKKRTKMEKKEVAYRGK